VIPRNLNLILGRSAMTGVMDDKDQVSYLPSTNEKTFFTTTELAAVPRIAKHDVSAVSSVWCH